MKGATMIRHTEFCPPTRRTISRDFTPFKSLGITQHKQKPWSAEQADPRHSQGEIQERQEPSATHRETDAKADESMLDLVLKLAVSIAMIMCLAGCGNSAPAQRPVPRPIPVVSMVSNPGDVAKNAYACDPANNVVDMALSTYHQPEAGFAQQIRPRIAE
jgi:hypothetical protein